jgi:hypothetical protein
VAGPCDVVETCDGANTACPADAFEPSSLECRATAGFCDIAENCTGSAAACPPDAFEPNTLECRADAGQCDVVENCTGSGALCPIDSFEPAATVCTDNDFCTAGDACDGNGACVSGIDVDTICPVCEACDPSDGSCSAGPRIDCLEPSLPAKARILIKDKAVDQGDLVVWKWIKGEATTVADFGDPTTTDGYTLCVFDDNVEVFRSSVPAAGLCGALPCWRTTGATGFKYINRDRTPDGVMRVLLKSGAAGNAKVLVKGKGVNLPFPASFLPMATPVHVQLQADSGTCWQTTHISMGPLLNTIDTYKSVSEGPTP